MKSIDPSTATKEDIIKRSNYIIHEVKEMNDEVADGIFDVKRLSKLFSFIEKERSIINQTKLVKYTNSRIFNIYRGVVTVSRSSGRITKSNFVTNLSGIKACYNESGMKHIDDWFVTRRNVPI